MVVRTVLGDIAPEAVGVALVHEHLLTDLDAIYARPARSSDLGLANQPIALENLGWIRLNYASNRANLGLHDEDLSLRELLHFQRAGGETIVELSGQDMGRDPEGLARLARGAGVHVIMGTGYYVESFHPPTVAASSEEEVALTFIEDITQGVTPSGIRAGIIGELGCSWPLAAEEIKVLRAAAIAQAATGAAITVHPGRDPAAPDKILDIIEAAGGDPRRTVICHLDRTIFEPDALLRLASRGCFLEYDMFGNESAHYPFAPIDLPNDGQRIDRIKLLAQHDHLEQVLVSHDIAYKSFLRAFGGYGYAHILETVVPKMISKGVSRDQVDTILVENPRRLLAFEQDPPSTGPVTGRRALDVRPGT